MVMLSNGNTTLDVHPDHVADWEAVGYHHLAAPIENAGAPDTASTEADVVETEEVEAGSIVTPEAALAAEPEAAPVKAAGTKAPVKAVTRKVTAPTPGPFDE